MKVVVKLFASLREAVGQSGVEIEISEGATVASLAREMERRFPQLASIPLMAAVNAEYVQNDHVLREGDEVAFLPPVSGGSVFEITDGPISVQDCVARVQGSEYGAVVTFIGAVRDNSQGKRVLYLEYDAYPEMAEKKMKEIGDEIREKWDVKDVAFVHRVGRVDVGEASVVIVVASAHRREAFAACQYAVDRLKEVVPIWKKEVWEGGEVWVGWETGRSGPESKEEEE